MARIDLASFREREQQGLITCREHPTGKLLIWNYTTRCQYEYAWDEVTTRARGLITTPDGTIVASPFKKFFNLDQLRGDLPLEPFTVTEKVDGSLGILFFLDGSPHIATRGSFTSDQAIKANAILQEKYSDFPFDPEYTYLFEIIYPAGRIVVDYGDREDLILIAVMHTETGHELDITARSWPFPRVKQYNGITDIAQLQKIVEENAEGFVIRFASGLRAKLKFSEYLRLHRLLAQVNAQTIWELLANNQPFDDLFERVPDEFYSWVNSTRDNLLDQYRAVEETSRQIYEQVKDLPTRKEQAAIARQSPHSALVFRMLDGREYAELIWRQLRPQAARPFRVDIDA